MNFSFSKTHHAFLRKGWGTPRQVCAASALLERCAWFGCKILFGLGGYMRLRTLLLFLTFSFLAVSALSAQHSPDPTQARLATVAHLGTLTQSDFKKLSAQAQSGDPEAQYWLALVYEQGRLVPKDSRQFDSWLFKSAEQGCAPAEKIAGQDVLIRPPQRKSNDPHRSLLSP